MKEYIWEAYAEYADGTSVRRQFEPNVAIGEAEDQSIIEAWLVERKEDCTFYSVEAVV